MFHIKTRLSHLFSTGFLQLFLAEIFFCLAKKLWLGLRIAKAIPIFVIRQLPIPSIIALIKHSIQSLMYHFILKIIYIVD